MRNISSPPLHLFNLPLISHVELVLTERAGVEGGGGRGKLSDVEHKLTVSAFARRRLPVVMTRLKMSQTVQMVNQYIHPFLLIFLLLFYFLEFLVLTLLLCFPQKNPPFFFPEGRGGEGGEGHWLHLII